MKTSSVNPQKNLVEEGEWLLAVKSFEAIISVFDLINQNNSFSISMPGCWRIPNYLPEAIIEKLKNLLKLRSQYDIQLQVAEVRERVEKKSIKLSLSDFDTFEKNT